MTLRHQRSHRWWSSPVVKNIELAKILLNDSQFLDFVLKKIVEDKIIFHPYKKVSIYQDNKAREIYVQNWVDKIIQIRIQEIISELIRPVINNRVYSFQKGRGPVHAIESFLHFSQNCKSDIFVLQLDISKYGDNIDQNILHLLLNETLDLQRNPLIATNLNKILNFEVSTPDGQRIKKTTGIPTGSPLVPLFENLYLLPVDNFIESIRPLFYCRYGDDMVLAYDNLDRVRLDLDRITAEINRLKLTVHPEKIKITKLTATNSFDWLGFKVTAKKQTGSKESHVNKIMKDLKREIHKHFYLLKLVNTAMPEIKQLSKSLEALEKKIYQKYANRIFNFYTSEEQTKQIDDFRIQQTHKAICRNFRIDKKIAWKILRNSKHKSANQVRMHYLRKKQWPKVPLKS